LGALLLMLSAGPLFAQATGTINGRVVDQGDAVLPGVTINIKNAQTGATRNTVTNAEGLYTVPALERGRLGLAALRTTLAAVSARVVFHEPIARGPSFEPEVARMLGLLISAAIAE